MHGLIVVGLASYSGGFANPGALNVFGWVCLGAGALLLGAAVWCLKKAPECR